MWKDKQVKFETADEQNMLSSGFLSSVRLAAVKSAIRVTKT